MNAEIRYNTGAGDEEIEVGDLGDALGYADKHAAYTGKPVEVWVDGRMVAQRQWNGVGFNRAVNTDTNPIRFGKLGFYSDWRKF